MFAYGDALSLDNYQYRSLTYTTNISNITLQFRFEIEQHKNN